MGVFDATRRRIAALAAQQHAVVSWFQLMGLEVTRGQVQGMVRRGELRRLHRGVYLAGPITTPHCYEMAAALAGGRGAAISHRSAVHLYELLPCPAQRAPVHITVAGRYCRGDSGIVVHQTKALAHYEVRERHGIPVTAPIRTLIDFAGGDATDQELERAVAEAFALRLAQRAPLLREVGGQ